jgi:hypothetical protein
LNARGTTVNGHKATHDSTAHNQGRTGREAGDQGADGQTRKHPTIEIEFHLKSPLRIFEYFNQEEMEKKCPSFRHAPES